MNGRKAKKTMKLKAKMLAEIGSGKDHYDFFTKKNYWKKKN